LPNNSLSYPKVCRRYDGLYYIDFRLNNKRVRMFSGCKINSSLAPNSYPSKLRHSKTALLAKEVYDYLVSNDYSFKKPLKGVELFDSLIESKLSEPLSAMYRKTLESIASLLRQELFLKGSISKQFLNSIPLKYNNNTSYNTTRRHLNVIVNYLHNNGFTIEKSTLKTRKQEEVLHKPISDLKNILERIKTHNNNLYICALLTYGCLLRPHHEIRLLRWSDFSDDLSYITLSGSRVKSKRNRVVPVPKYVRKELTVGDRNHNIFSGDIKPYNRSYFNGVWKRFKALNPELDKDITLYSFRHTGAIEIFKRTGSIHKLQRAMGHSSLNVSLTYLRGLEIAELEESDMPMI
jgi:integrase